MMLVQASIRQCTQSNGPPTRSLVVALDIVARLSETRRLAGPNLSDVRFTSHCRQAKPSGMRGRPFQSKQDM
jgi:hypothetical protein